MIPIIPHWLWGLWAGALVLVILGFGVLEGMAIANGFKSHDTLSEAVWEHGHIPGVVFFAGAGLIVFTMIWAMLHFVSKGKWGF